ncbi:hypothetical protein F2Q70_00039543 [Brassica cretica]|uniref:Uncharacterized protein n=1 Tax=Brassica cretica TaxID=69181 RepID=A0A8S9K9H0_BRACR|nr:hypothetical protein F2Q70_00039543 [Brassica cretica]
MSLNELQDQEHITLTAALKSLIHPFAFSFKYPQITGLPHGLGGDLLLLVCLEPGAQQPRGLRFLNRLLHTRTFPLLHTMVKSSAYHEFPNLLPPSTKLQFPMLLELSDGPLLSLSIGTHLSPPPSSRFGLQLDGSSTSVITPTDNAYACFERCSFASSVSLQ